MNTALILDALIRFAENNDAISERLFRTGVVTELDDYENQNPDADGRLVLFMGLATSEYQGRTDDLPREEAECCVASIGVDELHADVYLHTVQILVKGARVCRSGVPYLEGAGQYETSLAAVVDAFSGGTEEIKGLYDGPTPIYDVTVTLVDRASPQERQGNENQVCEQTLIELEVSTAEDRTRCR